MYCLKNFYQSKLRATTRTSCYIVFLFLLTLNICYSKNQSGIASAHPMATMAGINVLEKGGNAFDAAIAVASTLAVVEPFGSGIGGGGFFLFYKASEDKYTFIDARETAPAFSNSKMFNDDTGNYSRKKALDSPLSAAIPGLPAALGYIAEFYGRLDLTSSMAESINIAKKGFPVTERYRRMAGFRLECLNQFDKSSDIFLDKMKVPQIGFKIKQPELANTLSLISKDSSKFYNGRIAEDLVAGVIEGGGLWQLTDLSNYSIKERQPVVEDFNEIRLISAPPPSSGGLILIQALKILENFELPNFSQGDRVHLIVESMKKGFRDRAKFLGDPDFNNIDVDGLISTEYIERLRQEISINSASSSENIVETKTLEGDQTTHFSIIDHEGNIASVTLSINYPFGSCFVAGKTGVLLNNEMDDFSISPATPNAYGLVGLKPNSIEANKRPLSSMTPTILDSVTNTAVLGTPGGSRIISMVLLSILEYINGKTPDAWVSVPRYHHQFIPNKIQFEKGAFSAELRKALIKKGHELKEINRLYGNMQALLLEKEDGKVTVASDPRGEGASLVLE